MPNIICSIEWYLNRNNMLALTGLSKHFLEVLRINNIWAIIVWDT